MIEQHWHMDECLVVLAFKGVLTLDELLRAVHATAERLCTLSRSHYCVVDLSALTNHPQRLEELEPLFTFRPPETLAGVVLVGPRTTLMRFMATAVMVIFKLPYAVVSDWGEVKPALAQMRANYGRVFDYSETAG